MRLWPSLLLALLVVAAHAGDESAPAPTPVPAAPAPAAAVEAAPTAVTPAPGATPAPAATTPAPTVAAATPAPATPTYTEYQLRNDQIQVDVIDLQGAIRRVSLLKLHPIHLRPWQTRLMESQGRHPLDPAKPLPVLSNFNPAGGNHNWIAGIGLTDTAPWRRLSGDDHQLVLAHDEPAKGLRYTLRYDLPDHALALRSTLTIENLGSNDASLRPAIYPLNGIHQDDVKQDLAYLALAHHNGGTGGKMASLYLPALPKPGMKSESTVIPTDHLDYVCLKSRFFAALWHPVAFDIREAGKEAPAAAPLPAPVAVSAPSEGGPTSNLGGPVGATNAPAAAGTSVRLQVQSTAFTDYNGAHQAYVEATLANTANGELLLKPAQKLEAAWTLTIASMTSGDLKLIGDTAAKVEYTDGYYRFFKILASGLTFCLDALVLLVVNYGFAVVILTFLIKALLHRFTFKQHESMMKMQKVAPDLKLLQEQYKNDKQKLAQKQMELWKKHGINPLGGCLPIFIQIPIFTALYLAFCHSADMRGHGFLWVNDLTLADQVWYLGFHIPMWFPLPNWGGQIASLNPLPLIYIAVSIWMSMIQKVPPNSDPQQEQMMKMMRWLPAVFGVFFYYMPSGLVLYFTINAVLSTIEIKMVRRKLGMT